MRNVCSFHPFMMACLNFSVVPKYDQKTCSLKHELSYVRFSSLRPLGEEFESFRLQSRIPHKTSHISVPANEVQCL